MKIQKAQRRKEGGIGDLPNINSNKRHFSTNRHDSTVSFHVPKTHARLGRTLSIAVHVKNSGCPYNLNQITIGLMKLVKSNGVKVQEMSLVESVFHESIPGG